MIRTKMKNKKMNIEILAAKKIHTYMHFSLHAYIHMIANLTLAVYIYIYIYIYKYRLYIINIKFININA